MDDVSRLFGLSLCMFVGCYLAGAIPLAFTMSEVSLSSERFHAYASSYSMEKPQKLRSQTISVSKLEPQRVPMLG